MKKIYKVITLSIVSVFLLSPAALVAKEAPQKPAPAKEMTKSVTEKTSKVNLNSATVSDLSKIPGVGPKLGEKIGAYREANGAFNSIEELAKVDGVDAALVKKITPFISL